VILGGCCDDEQVRALPDPGFAGDDGSVPEPVAAALTAYSRDPRGQRGPVLAAIQHARLLVPVLAVLGEVEQEENGLTREKTSDMATVLMRGRDGRQALLGFTGTDALHRWNAEGRPVPVSARDAARAALHDGADALVLDVAGPVMFVVEAEELRSLAEGFTLTSLGGRLAWVRPEATPGG
jgi:hypothetical protein